jgi:aminomethyltransferase
VLSRLLGDDVQLPGRNGLLSLPIANGPVLIARTGYTGEDGFEWFCPAPMAAFWWDKILEAGNPSGILPCGLGARDTLRLEAGFPLNGSDLSPKHSPLEAGLSFFVKFDKGDFIGRAPLDAQRSAGVERKLVALIMGDKCPPPRPHYAVFHGGSLSGETTSGSLSPSLGAGIAMVYLPSHIATPGTLVEVEIRGKRFPATVAKRPLYRRPETPDAH